MDPNETLAQLRRMAAAEQTGGWTGAYANERCNAYAELVTALDQWLSRGGFVPAAWGSIRLPEGGTRG